MRLIDRIKNYFFTEEPEVLTLPDEAERWRSLAIELNNDLIETRKAYRNLFDKWERQGRLLKLYQELLAVKEK
jgi:hypothetical protein